MTRAVRRASVVAVGLSCAMVVMGTVVPFVWGRGIAGLGSLQTAVYGLPFVLLGMLIVLRRPGHPIGPSFVAAGFCSSVQAASIAYADAAFRAHGPHLPLAAYAANLTQWIFAPGVLLGYTMPFLWFPDGCRLSTRSRRVATVAVISTALMSVVNIIEAGPLNNYPHVRNPLSVHVPGDALLQMAGILVYIAALFAAIAAVFVRYRQATGVHRLQMRWFMVGVAGTAVGFALQMALLVLTGDVGFGVVLMGVLPVATGIAILRYRLFDIDRVISRTVTYTAVTALLGAPYVALTIAAGRLSSGSGIVVAALTLAALAVLRPLRRRVQIRVDRRFNRERYDAARVIEAFATRLRDEIDVSVVHADLLRTTSRAVAPASMSLWLATR